MEAQMGTDVPMTQTPQTTLDIFESAVNDLLAAFDIERPPVPVELILQRPKPGMWREINLSELSISFLDVRQRYSPRMSVARLLARNMCRCEWGAARGLAAFADSDEDTRMLARTLMVPLKLILDLSLGSRIAVAISARFEVPEEDARQRLIELGLGE
jgi:hypothetical protein